MLEQTDVVAHLVGGGRDACQHVCHPGVHLSGISLPGHGEALREPHLLSDHRVYLIDGLLVSVEQLQEGSLGARGALGAQKLHIPQHIVQILQIQVELLHPQRGPLPHRGGLGRLEMGEGQSGLGLMLFREIGQFLDDIHQLLLQEP
jgi:hypothetical protein